MLLALAVARASSVSIVGREPSPTSCDDLRECRTLQDIIWSCLVTILLCTWVSLHPNIPGPHEQRAKPALRRVGLMVLALIAPELVISWAMRQRVAAGRLAAEHKSRGWTNTHGFFALMGGFVAYDGERRVQVLEPHQLYGYSLSGEGDFPIINEEEIKDRSKGDIVSKALVIVQTGWFVVQCIARKTVHLPLTELELVTIAFATLNFAIYALWWDKPLNVQRAVRVYKKRGTDGPSQDGDGDNGAWSESLDIEEPQIDEGGPRLQRATKALLILPLRMAWSLLDGFREHGFLFIFWPFVKIGMGRDGRLIADEQRVSTFYPKPSEEKATTAKFLVAIIAAVFGAIHCLGWSMAFPSPLERILWRLSSVIITAAPLVLFLILGDLDWDGLDKTMGHLDRNAGFVTNCDKATMFSVWGLLAVMYVVCRVFLLLLPFLSLRALPTEVYRSVHWPTLIPHI